MGQGQHQAVLALFFSTFRSHMIIKTVKELDKALAVLETEPLIVFDFETLPSKNYPAIKDEDASLHHKTLEIEGLSLRSDTLLPVYIPFKNTEISRTHLYTSLHKLFSQDALFVAHNIQFDAKLAEYFFKARPKKKFCTLVGYWYIDENAPKDKVTLGRQLFNMKTISYKEAKKLSEEEFEEYALRDVEFAYRLYYYEIEKLKEFPKEHNILNLVTNIEMKFLDVLIDMTLHGTCIDIENLKKGEELLTNKALELEAEIFKNYGEINLKSPMQLCEKIYGAKITRKGGKVHIDWLEGEYAKPVNWTKPDNPENAVPSTDEKTLDLLDTPVANLIKEYRQTVTLLDKYAIGYQKWVIDGRIWPSFNHVGTVTGRLSSEKPNMQNLPSKESHGWWIKDAIYAPEGYVLIDADESQLEIRILAHFSGDTALTAAILSGKDIHEATAGLIFKKAKTITPDQRRFAKTMNFAIIYGEGIAAMAATLKTTKEIAKKFRYKYFDTFPGVKIYIDRAAIEMARHGYVLTLLGRHRTIPEIYSPHDGEVARAKRQTVNSIIQGSASDILKIAMIKINEEIKKRELDAHILLQIHDELLLEVKEEHAKEVCEIVKHYMEHPFKSDLRVPLLVEPKICKIWSEGK